jgi:hypothetical protein
MTSSKSFQLLAARARRNATTVPMTRPTAALLPLIQALATMSGKFSPI